MTAAARNKALASQARRVYIEALVRGMTALGGTLNHQTAQLLLLPAEYPVMVARRDGVQSWNRHGAAWIAGFISGLRHAAVYGLPEQAAPVAANGSSSGKMALVDDDTIEREITGSRLSLAMMDRATWEFTDLRTRMQMLEAHEDLDPQDLMRAHCIARLALDAWTRAGLDDSVWQMLQNELHEEFAQLLGEAYHETNRWLIAQGVLPEVDLRPFIRRSPQAAGAASLAPGFVATQSPAQNASGPVPVASAPLPAPPAEPAARSAASSQAEEVLQQLQRVVGRQVPGFAATQPQSLARGPAPAHAPAGAAGSRPAPAAGPVATPRLTAAIKHAQDALQRRADAEVTQAEAPQQLEELKSRTQALKQVLKRAADTPAERATIEIVAMMFQSILTEEHIPAAVRVWFARLQMPVLRVAVSEPDFFAATDHPARQLIDRMGACVMGFSTSSASAPGAVAEAVEREIKRVVQVVEAYPDTGRRVFATVLTEFEKFLDHYFEKENQASMKGVSLAQQVEQRETLAIQYTIELRKMLNEVPVQDGVREFLFQVWADVLAVTAVRTGAQSDTTKAMKRAAADLIWSASAKVSREERAEVIRRLPPLLKTLRDGMGHAGLQVERQNEHVRDLNNALAAAFTAKTAPIPRERLDELMAQLETLEALLPEGEGELQINESIVRDLSGHESDGLEVVAEGGSAPTPAMLAWARELQIGSWYMLDYRGRNEVVQLAWRGMRRQLMLFVTPQGRGVLFQLGRVAAFLQAGLLLPAQEEALTVKATRNALAKLDVDPQRLLN
ncbi:DUF1631 family protein [Roseateles violae]|uniref:DUF1631 family protein n=1 Tax=Roseateles violae TaxID=3058042 RepID=A0ABT8DXF0_9BURK|nr:DUF1631 family protein [Pelomonas sp. PFR6]MDN3921404.1 DUF1631 family protein [Pelomonas sp. PFR6]